MFISWLELPTTDEPGNEFNYMIFQDFKMAKTSPAERMKTSPGQGDFFVGPKTSTDGDWRGSSPTLHHQCRSSDRPLTGEWQVHSAISTDLENVNPKLIYMYQIQHPTQCSVPPLSCFQLLDTVYYTLFRHIIVLFLITVTSSIPSHVGKYASNYQVTNKQFHTDGEHSHPRQHKSLSVAHGKVLAFSADRYGPFVSVRIQSCTDVSTARS